MRRLLLTVVLASCGAPSPPPPQLLSYEADILPIFEAKCVACHFGKGPNPLNLFDAYGDGGLVNKPNSWTAARNTVLVVPGNPDASALMDKIDGTVLNPSTEGESMPFPVAEVTTAEVAAIRQWIAEGATDDALFQSTVRRVFGTASNLAPSNIGKCAHCHQAGAVYPPDVTRVFGDGGLVGKTSAYGGLIIAPGNPDASVLLTKLIPPVPSSVGQKMPINYPRLTAEEVATVRRWIVEGARP